MDGKPFARETVSCWLSCAHKILHGSEELGQLDKQQLTTVTGLTQVLAFSDAVGSCLGLCKALCSQVSQLKFSVQLPEQVLELPMAACSYWFVDKQLVHLSLQEEVKAGAPLASAEQRRGVQQQVAKQAATLLRLAHGLQPLAGLLDVLHHFLLHNALQPGGRRLLSGYAGLVFTDEVLEAVLGSSTISKEAYVSNVMSQPCSLTPGAIGHSSLLKPVGSPAFLGSNKVVEFEAVLLRDFAGGRSGDKVKATLDLFSTRPSGGGLTLVLLDFFQPAHEIMIPVQLLLGRTFADASALEAFLSSDPAAK
jgi:hypothetical protein